MGQCTIKVSESQCCSFVFSARIIGKVGKTHVYIAPVSLLCDLFPFQHEFELANSANNWSAVIQ